MVSLELLITRDNRTEAMRKVLNWLTEGCYPSPLMGEDSGEGDIRNSRYLRYYR